MNRVCNLLNIKYPVIQGPMAWITSPEMTAAVSNAGGLGTLGTSAGVDEIIDGVDNTVSAMRAAIHKTRQLTNKPFGVNVFPKELDPKGFSAAIVEMMKEEGVNILVVAGNIDVNEIKQWKSEGFIIIFRELNPTVRGAIELEKIGVDILVATGCDEGGSMPHLSTGTTAATALLSDAVNIPVLSAGGIVNQKMAKSAEVVGAEGVYAGTRFILSKECRASERAKEDILTTHPDDYIVFTQFNGFTKWRTTPHKIGRDALLANNNGDLNPSSGSFYHGILKGDLDAGVNTLSNVASLIKHIDSCEDIVLELGAPFAD